jgi:hypothetical protein
MEKYKIRIISRPGATLEKDLILACDHAAVRRGQKLRAPGERLEVYRRDECIFISEELGYVALPPDRLAATQ